MDLDRLSAALGPTEVAAAPPRDHRPRLRHARRHAGALFFCVPGSTVDGHDLAAAAVAAGAVALVVEQPVDVAVPQLRRAERARRDAGGGERVLRRSRRTSSTSPRSPARTARRRPRSCSHRSSTPPAVGPALLTNIERRVGGEHAADRAQHAGGDRPAAAVPRDARRGRPLVRDGGDVDRRREGTARRARASRCSCSRT